MADSSTADEIRGTFECPICGLDKPHHHTDNQVAAWREDRAREDGWISIAHRQPKTRGWYLCLGVNIDPDQYGDKKDFWIPNYRWSQLSWFLWVRSGGEAGWFNHEIPEVLFYDRDDGWRLRNLLGDAVASGKESRRAVRAQPKYWRALPAFSAAKSDSSS